MIALKTRKDSTRAAAGVYPVTMSSDTPNPLNDYLTTRQVADELGYESTQWIRDLIRFKKLKAVKILGKWVIHKDEFERFKREYEPKVGRPTKSQGDNI